MYNNTNYLKGVAIATIILGHYLKGVVRDDSLIVGNGFVSFFFILSGYGIFHSIRKSFKDIPFSYKSVAKFYLSRAIRIYPLFWLLILVKIVGFSSFQLSDLSILDFFAVRFTKPHFLWFIPSIIQCYIFAPFLYIFLRLFRHNALWIMILSVIFLNIILPQLGLPDVRVWTYRGVFFNNLLLFFVGLYLPILMETIHLPNWRSVAVFTFGLFVFALYQQNAKSIAFPFSVIVFNILFISSVSIFVFIFIQLSSSAPFMFFFSRLGIYTYSLYIFHGMFISSMRKLGLISNSMWGHFSFFCGFFILFIGSAVLEEIFRKRFKLREALRAFSRQMV